MRDLNYGLAATSAISCSASAAIILTYALFPDLRNLRFLEFVFYVAINDFIGSFCVGFFSLNTGRVQCFLQGFFTGYNYISAAFWTVVITYQLYRIVGNGKVLKDITNFHIICWIIPLVLTLLTLTTNTYGRYSDDDDEDITWCFIANTSRSFKNSILFWELMSFYLWLWFSIIAMFVMIILINIRLRKMEYVNDILKSSLQKLYFYPVVFIVSWILPSIVDIFIASTSDNVAINAVLNRFSDFLPVLQGFFLSCIFFTRNPIVRETWVAYLTSWSVYLRRNCCFEKNAEIAAKIVEDNDEKIRVIMSKLDMESDYIDRGSMTMRSSLNRFRGSHSNVSNNSNNTNNNVNNNSFIQMNTSKSMATNNNNNNNVHININNSNQNNPLFDASVHSNNNKSNQIAINNNNNNNNNNTRTTSNQSGTPAELYEIPDKFATFNLSSVSPNNSNNNNNNGYNYGQYSR